MLKSKLLAATVLSLSLFFTTQTVAQAAVGIRGIAFCNNGEEVWIDVGPYFYDRAEAKIAFDNQAYSVCDYRWGLSFFTRNYYYGGASCPTPSPYWETWETPYWGY